MKATLGDLTVEYVLEPFPLLAIESGKYARSVIHITHYPNNSSPFDIDMFRCTSGGEECRDSWQFDSSGDCVRHNNTICQVDKGEKSHHNPRYIGGTEKSDTETRHLLQELNILKRGTHLASAMEISPALDTSDLGTFVNKLISTLQKQKQ